MKSPLFFVKLLVAAFFLLAGMHPASAQRVSDLSTGHSLRYSAPCLGQGLGRPQALNALSITTAIECKIRPALHVGRPPIPWAPFMQGRAEYAPLPGLHDLLMLQAGVVPSSIWNHGAAGFISTSDKGLRGVSPSLSARAAPSDQDQSRALPFRTIKLVLMSAALALLVVGVGHTAAQRW